MARTPNYGQQRADRNRVKQEKKEAKLREREAAAARRKAEPRPAAEPNEKPDGKQTRR
jgi:hypothetical protein